MIEHHPSPTKEHIAGLELFVGLGLDQITLIATAAQAQSAFAELAPLPALGFDTESKPIFRKDQVSDGPHLVQFATAQRAYIFQLHQVECRQVVAELLASESLRKIGFGLSADRTQIQSKFGVWPNAVLDLDTLFRARGYRMSIGVKTAVAMLFNQRFVKSKRMTTSNWANAQLTDAQLLYAANDAYSAIKVFEALGSPTSEEVDLDLSRHAATRPPANPATKRSRRRRSEP